MQLMTKWPLRLLMEKWKLSERGNTSFLINKTFVLHL